VQVGCTINYARTCLWKQTEEFARVDYPGNVGENGLSTSSIPIYRAVGFLSSFVGLWRSCALPWHGRGRRFDPDQVHHIFIFPHLYLSATFFPQPRQVVCGPYYAAGICYSVGDVTGG
jgi:hypothetical protein